MANISNREILELLEERDKKSIYHKGEISRSFNRGNVGKLYDINCLIQCLKNDNYTLTDSDVELLREYNIFTVKKSKSHPKDSFVAISDFHGYNYPIHKILNYYLEEYEYIYILGDATDRGPYGDGTGSIELLRMIKKLSELYPGRIIYVPGNHDSFIIGYDRGDITSTLSMKRNKGSKTYEELESLKKNNPWEYNNLINWLENLPLQRIHKYNGKYYAFAHAFFDQLLYNKNLNFNLDDYFDRSNVDSNLGTRVLWFRKKDLDKTPESIADAKVQEKEKKYVKMACPDSDITMVVGHSICCEGSRSLDLINRHGDTVKVHCVDGGIAYDGVMLKYDGGEQTNKTVLLEHSSPKSNDNNLSLEMAKACLNNYIVSSIYDCGKEAFSRDLYLMPITITNEEFADIIDSYDGKCGFSYDSGDYQDRYCLYRKIVVFDMIIQSLFDKYYNVESVINIIDGFLFGNNRVPAEDPVWFTRENDIRFLASMLGRENIIDVLVAYNCRSILDYIKIKTMVGDKGKVKIKA